MGPGGSLLTLVCGVLGRGDHVHKVKQFFLLSFIHPFSESIAPAVLELSHCTGIPQRYSQLWVIVRSDVQW